MSWPEPSRTPTPSCTLRAEPAGAACHLRSCSRYSDAYASNQFRALQQFVRWLAEAEQLPDPMAGLRASTVIEKLVPVFTSEELCALQKACHGRSFGQRRDAAITAVLTATGTRAGELAGICYNRDDPRRSDVDL